MLNTDHRFYEMCGEMSMLGYAGIYVANATSISSAPSTYSLDNVNFMNSQMVSINCKYVHTTWDLSYDSFVQAIAKKNYNKNECWINSIIDFYGDTLMDEKKRSVLTRAKLLSIIGKTEENIKDGVKYKDILPFFIQYKLQLRVYDCFFKLVFKYEPEKRNHHNKAMYCMAKDDHVYSLNHDIDSLKHKEETDTLVAKASSNYYIRDDKKIQKYKMIESADDMIKIIHELEAKRKAEQKITSKIENELNSNKQCKSKLNDNKKITISQVDDE